MEFKEKTAQEVSEMNSEEQIKYFNDLNKHRADKMAKLEKELIDKADKTIEAKIEELKAEMNKSNVDQLASLQKALETQGLAIKDMMSKGSKAEAKTLADQLEANKEVIKGFATGATKSLVVRADVTDNDNAYDLPEIGQLDVAVRNAYAIFPKLRISDSNDNGVIRYYDWDEDTSVRAAAMVAEGAAFPSSTAKWKRYTMDIEKIGDSIGYADEMVEDSQMFAAELGMFIDTNVKIVENNQIVNGDGTGNNLTGLVTSVPAYTPVASGITDASIYDLGVVVKADISKLTGGKYNVDFALMNLVDIQKYKLKKDANNNYIMPPFYDASGNRIDGMFVIEDNTVTANTMIVGDRKFARIYEKTGYEMTRGMVNNQFLEDEETMKVRKRLAFLIRNCDKSGFRKVTDIDAALVTLAS